VTTPTAEEGADFRRLDFDLPSRGGRMAAIDLGDPGRAFDMVFIHANGFNARTYLELLRPLAKDLRILMPDLRGHGRTSLPAAPEGRRSWDDHFADIAALLDQVGTPVVMAGHSMGGTTALAASWLRPTVGASVVLFDPVIWSRPAALAFGLPGMGRVSARIPLVKGALRRRKGFPDREAAFAAYRGRGAFRDWPDAMLRDYLADGLVADPYGEGLILACAPEWEASNYAAQAHNPWRVLDRIKAPVRILRAEQASTCAVGPSPTRGRRSEVVPGGTHFFPMVMPDVARQALKKALGEALAG